MTITVTGVCSASSCLAFMRIKASTDVRSDDVNVSCRKDATCGRHVAYQPRPYCERCRPGWVSSATYVSHCVTRLSSSSSLTSQSAIHCSPYRASLNANKKSELMLMRRATASV